MKKLFSQSILNILIIILVIIVNLKPQIGPFKFDFQTSLSVLFGFLALDNIIERLSWNNLTSQKLDTLQSDINSLKSNNILKKRTQFDRLEITYSTATRSIFISGLTLASLTPANDVLKERLSKGVSIRILVLDPDGDKIPFSAEMNSVNVEERKSFIRATLSNLIQEFPEYISNNKLKIRLFNGVMMNSFIGIDIEDKGRIIITDYLYKDKASKSPMLDIRKSDGEWYALYAQQIEKYWNDGRDFTINAQG